MNPTALLPVLLLLGAGAAHAGTALVSFDPVERYSDIGPERDTTSVQNTLASHLQALAAQHLPAGHTLTVAVSDIDLAGEIPPVAVWNQDVRVMGKHPDSPRISLRYSLSDGSRVLAQGSEVVTDMAYLMRARSPSLQRQTLPYERRMLADWFDSRFGKAAGL